jgi:hypothetical protein
MTVAHEIEIKSTAHVNILHSLSLAVCFIQILLYLPLVSVNYPVPSTALPVAIKWTWLKCFVSTLKQMQHTVVEPSTIMIWLSHYNLSLSLAPQPNLGLGLLHNLLPLPGWISWRLLHIIMLLFFYQICLWHVKICYHLPLHKEMLITTWFMWVGMILSPEAC